MTSSSSDAAAWADASAETVFLILDTHFGERLLTLPTMAAIWLADSALNTPVARQFWRAGQPIINAGQSTFTYSPSEDSADFLESMLITIHDHHGPSSYWGGYSTLIVIGLPITDTIEEILANDNLQINCVTESGFVAKRID